MLKNRRKLLVSFLILLLLGLAGWFTFAVYSKKWLEARVNLLMADLRKNGATITYSSISFSVNPLFIQANITTPHIRDAKGLIDWQGQGIKIFIHPWERFTLNFASLGDQKVVVPQHTLQLDEVKGVLELKKMLTLTVGEVLFLQGNQVEPVSLKNVSLTMSDLADPLNLKISMSTQVMNIEKLFNKEPNNQPLSITFIGDFSGFKPQFSFPKSLAEWRNGGGVLEVRLLKIEWPPILAETEGTLTLDGEMYLLGSFSSRLSGYEQAIKNMVELGWIKKKKANIALFMLNLLASSNEKSGKKLIVPITLQNKTFSVGPAPLLKLKPIEESSFFPH